MIRSLFFVPANRHDLIAKLPRVGADCSVLDLEDGTPPTEKGRARDRIAAEIDELRHQRYAGRLLVRVNEPASPHYLDDVKAALAADVDGVLIPKLETADQLFPALHILGSTKEQDKPDRRRKTIAAGIETMRGVINAVSLCTQPLLDLVYFGAEDYIADVGGVRTDEGDEVLYARSQVVLAARVAGITAIDQAVADVRNDELYRSDARKGRSLGYQGKICVLPRQLALCHEVYSPTEADVETAVRLIAAYEEALRRNIGTIEFEGKLIDGPMLKKARGIVAMTERLKAAGLAP